MSRRMSCALTADAVRDRTKTVTRRHTHTWTDLAPGQHVTLVEKAMGLRKGERQVVLADVEIVANDIVALSDIDPADVAAEGFGPGSHMGGLRGWTPRDFVVYWLGSHGLDASNSITELTHVRRIEWRYLHG